MAAFIIMLAPPPPPVVNFTNTSVCFWNTSPVEYYLVTVTDASGNKTSLSGTYNTSQCLTITSDLYSVYSTVSCILFTVSVVAVNRVGTSRRTQNIIFSDDLQICQQGYNLTSYLVNFQLHLYAVSTCTEWINRNQSMKFHVIAAELAVFMQQRCNCFFSSSYIFSPQFICAAQYVTYRASIDVVSLPELLNRIKLIPVLEEWPLVHRSILIQGERLSVDDTCPVFIESLQDEVCEVTMRPTGTDTVVATISLSTFTIIVSILTIVVVTMAIIIITCSWMHIKLFLKNFKLSTSPQQTMEFEVRDHPSPPMPHDSANIHIPEYEEIQELHTHNTNTDMYTPPEEHNLTYKFNQCPAYVATGQFNM